MAQSKLNDLAGKFGKGGPPGLGIGLKLLGVAGALVYGVSQSIYTGNLMLLLFSYHIFLNTYTDIQMKYSKNSNSNLTVRYWLQFRN